MNDGTGNAKAQKWDEPNDDVHVAHKKLKEALYDAQVYAERYERALNGTKAETEDQSRNLARRYGWARVAHQIINTLYVDVQ